MATNSWRVPRILGKAALGTAAVGAALFGGVYWNYKDLHGHPRLVWEGINRYRRFAICSMKLIYIYKNPFSRLSIEEKHSWAGKVLNATLRKNSGTSIKLGQVLAMMDVLLPEEFTDELTSLFQQAPQSKFDDIRAEIESQLGRKFEDIFATFNEKPIASGSIAQVYEATLKENGKRVAVKVRHASLREAMEFDLAVMRFFVEFGSWVDKDFNYRWLSDDASENLRKELNFKNEMHNILKITNLMKGARRLVFPTVLPEYCGEGVLTMEFIDGYSITNVKRLNEDKIPLDVIAETMAESFAKMIFDLGFVHADPHPGNIFVQKNGPKDFNLVLLDNGLYAELSDQTRINYAKMWRGIITRNEELLKESTNNLGVGFAFKLFTAMITNQTYDQTVNGTESDIKQRLKGSSPAEEKRRQNSQLAKRWRKEILECLEKMNRDMILLFKINNYIESIDTKLGQPINNYWYTAKYAFGNYIENNNVGWWQSTWIRLELLNVLLWLKIYECGLSMKVKNDQSTTN